MKREYSERERYLLWLGFVLGPGSKRYFRALTAFENDAHAMCAAAQTHDLPPECGLKEPIFGKAFRECDTTLYRRMLQASGRAGCFSSGV